MIVYNHTYFSRTHNLIIEPIEVTETPKMIKAKGYVLGNYNTTFPKENFDTLIDSGFNSFYMVSTIPNKPLFIKLIREKKEHLLTSLKENISKCENEITYLNKLSKEE